MIALAARLVRSPETLAVHHSIDLLFEKYRPLGRTEAGDLLLGPNVAARLAGEVAVAGISIIGVAVWFCDGQRPEELYGVDLSGLPDRDALRAAQDFLARWQPDGKHFFSLIVREALGRGSI